MTVNKVVIKNKADIHPEDTVKYMVTNNYVHERKSLYTNHKANIIKKGKGNYFNKNTGEKITKVKNSNLKIQNRQSLIRSYVNLRYTIEKYVTGSIYDEMYTLTYEKAQTSFKDLSHDFVTFMKRFKRYVKKNYPKVNLSWIRINEPHKDTINGKPKWHIHLIVIGLPFMKHHILEKLWGHGIVTITSYYKCNIHKVANYFTGFINKNDSDPESKKGRLKYYTSGTDLFSLSRGLHVPKWIQGTDQEIRKNHPGKIINETTIEIRDTNDNSLFNRFAYRDIESNKTK